MRDVEGAVICPDCNKGMYCDPPGNRDTESMGGYEIEYWYCPTCKRHYSSIYGDDEPSLVTEGFPPRED